MNLTKSSRSCSHFGITIFEQEEGKRGISLYQTWHIVNSITLYHITSHSIMLYQVISNGILLYYHTKLHHLISHSILLCSILFYPIQSLSNTGHNYSELTLPV